MSESKSIDGNVIIVTELADQSLKRNFDSTARQGLPGSPREELLGYLRDAADALDYIYDNYSLQHLDIKPENLLLVGNRAKVADFGLVKNLYDRSASHGRWFDAGLRSAGAVRGQTQPTQRSIQPRDRLPGDADRRTPFDAPRPRSWRPST